MSRQTPNRQAQNTCSHVELQRDSRPATLEKLRGLSKQRKDGGDAYGHKDDLPSQIPLSMYERSDVSYVMFKGRWGRLSPEVRFGREQGLLGINRGHDRAKRTVEWSLSGCGSNQMATVLPSLALRPPQRPPN